MDINTLKRQLPRTQPIGARIDADLKARVELFCKTNNVSISAIIAELLREFLSEQV